MFPDIVITDGKQFILKSRNHGLRIDVLKMQTLMNNV